MGRDLGLTELAFQRFPLVISLEAVLATSFPDPGDMQRVREIYRQDATSGADRLGMNARYEAGENDALQIIIESTQRGSQTNPPPPPPQVLTGPSLR